jgi:hypothetical protein
METKEIAMSDRTRLLGTACVVAAALAAGPAAADTLMGFNGFAESAYSHTTFSDTGNPDTWNTGSFGLGMAMPLADIPNMNWQIDALYTHGWSNDYDHSDGGEGTVSYGDSEEVWDFGFSPFWAGPQSRFGANFNYETITHFGHITNGGAFFEWYLMDTVTVSGKGGYLSTGGTPFGGHGHYLGGGVTFYGMPNLAITGFVDWQDVVTGGAAVKSYLSCDPQCNLVGTHDFNSLAWSIDAEFLPNEDWGVAIFGGFTYTQNTFAKDDFNDSTFHVGLRYYTGAAGGSLMNRHRNGNLHGILRGP